MKNDIAIIGGGPSGITAAIQLKRYGFNPLIFERDEIGGLILNANLIENFPGFPNGLTGTRFANLLEKQLATHSINIIKENVLSIQYNNEFIIKTSNDNYLSDYCIVASGTKPNPIDNIEINEKLKNNLIYDVKHLYGVKGKRIVIIGSGDAALDYAINLSKKNNIKILSRSNTFKALPTLVQRIKNIPEITLKSNTNVKKAGYLNEEILLNCISFDKPFDILCDNLVIAIGRKPELGFIKDLELIRAKTDKFYIVGDVVNGLHRQAVIAAGDGMRAAMDIYYRINQGENEGNCKNK